jgi:hypothetical protein
MTLAEIRSLLEIAWTHQDRQFLLAALEQFQCPEAQELREAIHSEEFAVVLEQCPYEGGQR